MKKGPNFKLLFCKYTGDFYGTLANSENRDETPHIHKSLSLKDSVFAYLEIITFDSSIYRVKLGKFGHQVNSDTHLQPVEIHMRRLLMSSLIRIFNVCFVNLFFIPIINL